MVAGWLGAGKRYEGAANEGDLGRFIVDRQNAVDGQGKTGGLRQHLPNPDTATSSSDLERWRRRRREGDDLAYNDPTYATNSAVSYATAQSHHGHTQTVHNYQATCA